MLCEIKVYLWQNNTYNDVLKLTNVLIKFSFNNQIKSNFSHLYNIVRFNQF
jgi:hypothetical protein